MCLIIPSDRESFIAKEDITTYKILKIDGELLFSPYWNDFHYECDKLYTTILKESLEDFTPFDATDGLIVSRLVNPKSIAQGFHSALTKERLQNHYYRLDSYNRFYMRNFVLRECIIPKGSECYLGFTDLIVSNQIIIKNNG